MEIKRQQPVVENYHFDMRDPNVEPEKKFNVSIVPLKSVDENYPKENSIVGTRLEFAMVFPQFVISGAVNQVNHIINRQVTSTKDLSSEEADTLVEPLFDILKRLTYEVTEIITDKPGMKLNFKQE